MLNQDERAKDHFPEVRSLHQWSSKKKTINNRMFTIKLKHDRRLGSGNDPQW
jgi:hypothetical protein